MYPNTDLRRFCSHLDADLQDGDGELRVWTAAEPQSEVRVWLLHLQLLHKLIQLWHPAEGQVTIGQEYPVTLQYRQYTVNVFYCILQYHRKVLKDFIHRLKSKNHLVQNNTQHHRKVLLSSSHLNGHT